MVGLFFTTKTPIPYFREVMACDVQRFNRFFHAMLDDDVYPRPRRSKRVSYQRPIRHYIEIRHRVDDYSGQNACRTLL
jgi:glutamate-1-semialdehyde aminotransferase